jgi:hypothetical protein
MHPVQYQNPKDLTNKAIVAFRMLPARPLQWAIGTNFDPTWEDANQIVLRIHLETSETTAIYEQLVQWLVRNVNGGDATPLTLKKASELWDDVQK